MIVYHGSYMEVKKPNLFFSRKNLDFGLGFYTTPIYDQAKKWSNKFIKNGSNGIINEYEIDDLEFKNFKVLKFDNYSLEWLDFISSCRQGKDNSNYDIVIGGIANDKVFNTVELYFDGLIDKYEAIKRLKYNKPNLQICFRSVESLNCLKFVRSIKI